MSNLRRVSVFGGREITQDIFDETVILGNMLALLIAILYLIGGIIAFTQKKEAVS